MTKPRGRPCKYPKEQVEALLAEAANYHRMHGWKAELLKKHNMFSLSGYNLLKDI